MAELRGPTVVCGWGIGNAVLVGILIGYGDRTIPMALYAGSVALIEVIGLVAWWVLLRHGEWAAASPAPQAGRVSLLAMTLAIFIGIGLIWDLYFMIPAAYPFFALIGEAVEQLRAGEEPSSEPAEESTSPHLVGGLAASAVAGAAAGAGWRWWTRRSR